FRDLRIKIAAFSGVAGAEFQVKPDHPASRFEGLEFLGFADQVLQLEARGPASAVLVIQSSQPLAIRSASNAKARLEPGWDGTVGYGHYRLMVTVPVAGKATVRLETIPPPKTSVSTSEKELADFSRQLHDRCSRFSDDSRGFVEWQRTWRTKLAVLLMGGGLPERVPLGARVAESENYPNFTLHRVEYRSGPDRTNVLLLSLPKGVTKAPLLLALHGHEAAWGGVDPKAYQPGHADDFMSYFAERGWAVLQPATMNHALRHKGWTLQGEWTWDAMTALDYAATVPEVDMDRVAVCGLSTGGHLAMNVLALDDRVKAGVVGCILSTWNHYQRRFRIPPHCDCGISFQLGPQLEQCDWAALSAPRPVQFQHGRQDAAFCPGADQKRLDLQWNTGVMPQAEYDAMFSEVKRAYGLAGNADATETVIHDGPHKVDNEAAFEWLNRWLEKASNQNEK
ncbi:MAG: acetylxylan esterase, partial [Verrucomicrobia bacterium]|nr:acetylxylan esterase [Verrucomicrobiota bacterium]